MGWFDLLISLDFPTLKSFPCCLAIMRFCLQSGASGTNAPKGRLGKRVGEDVVGECQAVMVSKHHTNRAPVEKVHSAPASASLHRLSCFLQKGENVTGYCNRPCCIRTHLCNTKCTALLPSHPPMKLVTLKYGTHFWGGTDPVPELWCSRNTGEWHQ